MMLPLRPLRLCAKTKSWHRVRIPKHRSSKHKLAKARADCPGTMQVAEAPIPKLVMLGNHDAWTCLTRSQGATKWARPLEEGPAQHVMQQIAALGDTNLAWNCKPIHQKPLSVVGTRPFSKVRSFSLKSCTCAWSEGLSTEYQQVPRSWWQVN